MQQMLRFLIYRVVPRTLYSTSAMLLTYHPLAIVKFLVLNLQSRLLAAHV